MAADDVLGVAVARPPCDESDVAVDFIAVGQSVLVCVRILRIGAHLEFLEIGQAVVVGIERGVVDFGIEPVGHFVNIRHTVAIRVSRRVRHDLEDDDSIT